MDPKNNIYTTISMIIYELRHGACLYLWNYSMELSERGIGKENDRASVILHNIRCEGRGHKDVY
jgi:hypothetical protein